MLVLVHLAGGQSFIKTTMIFEKAPWMRVVGLPSLPSRYALTRWGKLDQECPYCTADNANDANIQGGRNRFHERPLHRAQATDNIS